MAGKESDVQLVGQVILALGGEAVPLTENAKMSWFPMTGTAAMSSGNAPFTVQMNGTKISPQSGSIHVFQSDQIPQQLEDARQQLEKARNQSNQAAKQVQEAMKQFKIEVKPATPVEPKKPQAPTPPDAPAVKP